MLEPGFLEANKGHTEREREREKQSVCVRKEKKDGLSGAHIRPYVIVWKIFDSVMPCVSGLIYEYDTVSERV